MVHIGLSTGWQTGHKSSRSRMKETAGKKSAPRLPGKIECLRLFEQMVLLRQSELAAQKNYKAGRMPGFIHLYIGEEASAVGVCASLRKEDWITSTHRGHGHALAKGLPVRNLMAELYGKAAGCCGGRGGSMHLFDPAIGLFGTNGIVAGGLPAAVGAAITAKTHGKGHVVVAFFGDGAVNHGAFHESVNFATLQQAPVVFVCENNLYATATPFSMATRQTSVAARAAAYGLPGVEVDGNDVLAVYQAAHWAVQRARAGEGPSFIECETYRWRGHHMGDQGDTYGYRTQAEIEEWMKRCPVVRHRNYVVQNEIAPAEALDTIESNLQTQIDQAVEFAKESAYTDPEEVFKDVYA